MSGTVEKQGKLRWASRWLVLTRTRLYVLRSAVALCPLNVIPLDDRVRVTATGRLGTVGFVNAERALMYLGTDKRHPRFICGRHVAGAQCGGVDGAGRACKACRLPPIAPPPVSLPGSKLTERLRRCAPGRAKGSRLASLSEPSVFASVTVSSPSRALSVPEASPGVGGPSPSVGG